MTERGFTSSRGARNGRSVWKGVRLKPFIDVLTDTEETSILNNSNNLNSSSISKNPSVSFSKPKSFSKNSDDEESVQEPNNGTPNLSAELPTSDIETITHNEHIENSDAASQKVDTKLPVPPKKKSDKYSDF